MQHEEDLENSGSAKVVDWHVATSESRPGHPDTPHDEGAYESDYASSQSSYAHHHRTQSQPAKLFRNGELLVHRDFSGQIPLCFYATGLESGGSHDYYECFDERDILWARRVRFHINRVRYS